jgi:hypothetical protein
MMNINTNRWGLESFLAGILRFELPDKRVGREDGELPAKVFTRCKGAGMPCVRKRKKIFPIFPSGLIAFGERKWR